MTTHAQNFCCSEIQTLIESGDLHLYYDPKLREFGIRYADDNVSIQVIRYCPWCGSELPPSLRVQWFEALAALGIEPDEDVPRIYRSDAWWRKPQ